ncbi:MAG: LysM peptidoglycan-binding domain-containing protein [Ilumatobacteraceae bacterium]
MGTPRSKQGARRSATTTITTAGLIGAMLLSSCIDSATSKSAETTLVPLVAPAFVTLAPATSTTLVPDATTTTVPPNVNPGATVAPTPTISAVESPATTAGASDSTTANGSYTVAAHDTVYGIARAHGITADELATLNGWSDGATHGIFPGDKVKVPDATTAAAATTVAESPSTTTTVKSTATTSTVSVGSGGTYVIKANDYLSLIAKNTGTTVDGIISANGWSDGVEHLLIPGDTIKLPAKSS